MKGKAILIVTLIAIRNSLGQLSSLTGALKIHEIFIGEDLVVMKKMLPNDPFYKAVLIKESAEIVDW